MVYVESELLFELVVSVEIIVDDVPDEGVVLLEVVLNECK